MGYISDVAAVFYAEKEDFPMLKLFFKENFPYDDFGQCVEEFDSHYAGFKFICEGVKWYESSNDVNKFNEFVGRFNDLITDQGQPWHYEFCRVGEEYNDIEFERGRNTACLLDVSRTIHFEL
jgi:hypothetical protein